MAKILFLVRSTKSFCTQRRDIDYIIENLIKEGHSIHIFDPKQKLLMDVNKRTLFDYNMFPQWMFFWKSYIVLNFFVLIRFLKQNQDNFDVVHIWYMREEYLLVPCLIKGLAQKINITLFGSDINHRTFLKNNFTKIYGFSDRIITTNAVFKNKFLTLLNKSTIADKTEVLLLPQPHFKFYTSYNLSDKETFKKKLSLSPTKIIVMVGTNLTENEQHEIIIAAFKNLDPNMYHLIFPLANVNGVEPIRQTKLMEFIYNELPNFSKTLITKFISDEEMRDLRFASDIFLNFRKNDQFATSMLESNLAFTHVVTGAWLPYAEYTAKVSTYVIDEIIQLPEILNKINSAGIEIKSQQLILNKQNVLQYYSTNTLKRWVSLYN